MNFAVKTKDDILAKLHDAVEPRDFIHRAHEILDALTLTSGIWTECGYAYKAQEIAQIIRARAFDEGHEELLNKAGVVAQLFHEQQCLYFAQVSDFWLSDLELAS